MKILIIGNGFDLEHGLPTRYSEFLEFVDIYRNGDAVSKEEYLKKGVRSFRNTTQKETIQIWNACIEDNKWIDHFQKRYSKRKPGENWIDFESEISRVVQANEKCLKQNVGDKKGMIESLKSSMVELSKDLNRLICALEIYLNSYIDKIDLKYYNPDIESIRPDKVLSFNYTNTFARLYEIRQSKVDYDYIHGKATFHDVSEIKKIVEKDDITEILEKVIEDNNMVLGIDEYLPEDKASKELDFITFKKYYQRIYKQTGNRYKKWLNTTEEHDKIFLYIFGHSLDVTDGDVLRELIKHKKVTTIIYYRNKKQLGEQIVNLVRVLGRDVVIEKVSGKNPTIVFKLQQERRVIKTDNFEICSDCAYLRKIPMSRRNEAKKIIKKLDEKVAKKDYTYFLSQENILELYDALLKIGLNNYYKRALLEIAFELDGDAGISPKQHEAEEWAECNLFSNCCECEPAMKTFIDEINKKNKEKFMLPKITTESVAERLQYYEDYSKTEDKIDKDKFEEIIKDVFILWEAPETDLARAYNVLCQIATGPAKECAEEVINTLKNQAGTDLFSIVRYNKLLIDIAEVQEWEWRAQEQMQDDF